MELGRNISSNKDRSITDNNKKRRRISRSNGTNFKRNREGI
jgi:hypothetical protein